MSKRPSSSELAHPAATKKPKTDITQLLARAKGLVGCLQALHDDDPLEPDATQRLSELSRDILPSLQALAAGEGSNSVKGGLFKPEPVTETFGSFEISTSRSSKALPQQVDISHGPIHGVIRVSRWVSSEIPNDLPPMPKILTRELEEAAFTHPGCAQGVAHYERLEWLGDAFIELISTILIERTFTLTPSGRCSQLREQIVRNVNLAQYFRQYNMQSRARLPPEIIDDKAPGRGRSKDKDLIKTQADMFEAYVAAAIISDPEHGLPNTTAWLKALWGRTLRDEIRKTERSQAATAESTQPKAFPPKDLLQKKIGAKGVRLKYEDIPNHKTNELGLPFFTIGVFLDGWGETNKLLGLGTALAKKEAGQNAAAVALENKKLMKLYEGKKAAFLGAQAL